MNLKSYEIGQLGEAKAREYMIENGYTIIDLNYHSRFGEIDIIAQRDNIVAFVEVKTRSKDSIADPVEAVDLSKIDKILKTAQLYICDKKVELQPRFDICEVTFDRLSGLFEVSDYIEDAFSQGGEYAIL